MEPQVEEKSAAQSDSEAAISRHLVRRHM